MYRIAVIFGLLIATFSCGSSAGAYKCKDTNGSVVYTDTPCQNGKSVQIHDSHMGEPPLPKSIPKQNTAQDDAINARREGCRRLVAQYENARRAAADGRSWGEYFDGTRTTKQLAPGYNECLSHGY